MSTPAMSLLYKEIVEQDLNAAATIDDDGDVIFSVENLGDFLIFSRPDLDPSFLRLFRPGIADERDFKGDREKMFDAANSVNHRVKGAKIGVVLDDDCQVAYVATEAFLGAEGEISSVAAVRATVVRSFHALLAANLSFLNCIDE